MMMELCCSALKGIKTLVFPPICIACNRRGDYVCQNCLRLWGRPPVRIKSHPIELVTVLPYNDYSSRVVLAAKEDGNKSAQRLIAHSLASGIQVISADRTSRITVVPIPSRPRNVRRRGEKFLIPIVLIANQRLREQSAFHSVNIPKIEIRELLVQGRSVKEQSGLSMRDRQKNMEGALELDTKVLRNWRESPVIIVDDVITTGSTMVTAFDALKRAKITVLGGVSACATSARMRIP